MREMWQLPKKSLRSRAWRILKIAALLWAAVALPLTLWLTLRTPTPTPAPTQRPLTTIEAAAVRYGSQALLTQPVALTSTVTSPMAQLQVEETVDPARGVIRGGVRSSSQTAELLVVADRVLLRGGSGFWASLGVPTAESGWVDVGDRLGAAVPFPLSQAAAALATGPQALMDSAPEGSTSATFHNGTLTAVFGDDGLTSITHGERTATVSHPNSDALAKLAASPPPDWDKAVATLSGSGGALTVIPAVPPAPAAPPLQ